MEIVLERMYFPEGTNGVLSLNGKEICKTIELHGEIIKLEFRVFQRENTKSESVIVQSLSGTWS